MTIDEFLKELEQVSGVQYSEHTKKFFFTAIVNQFKAYKKSYKKLEDYVQALDAIRR